MMANVTIQFKNWWQAFVKACEWKLTQYQLLTDTLRSWGFKVVVEVLIVGAFGAWNSRNESVLHAC